VPRDGRFDINIGADIRSQTGARELTTNTARVAVIGNFSGRSDGSGDAPRVWPVDRDNLDDVIAAAAPRLRLALDRDLPPVDVAFSCLEDFHPDRLAARVPLFQTLRALKDAPPPAARQPSSSSIDADELTVAEAPTGSFLDMIIDADPATPIEVVRRAAPKDDLGEFVARSVRKHAVTDRPAQAAEVSAKVDALVAATMRVLLHHPDFQALESAWRGVDFLLRRLDTDGRLRLFLIDAPPRVADMAIAATSDRQWSAVVLNEVFSVDDTELLGRIAAAGEAVGAGVIVGGKPDFVGAPAFPGHDDVEDWPPEMPDAWDELRLSPASVHLAVALPRLLLRLPYGRGGEECETFRFEEVDPGIDRHDAFLWGSGALTAAVIALDPLAEGDSPATHGTIDSLPLHITTVDGAPESLPCAEVVLGERELNNLLERGLTPIASMRDGDMVRAPRIQSVARPPRRLAIPG
jgi:type VI secretion system protein ImpC